MSQSSSPSQPAAGSMLSLRNVLVSVGLSLGVLALIGLFTLDLRELGALLRAADPGWLLAAAASVVVRVLFGAQRLAYISRGKIDLRAGLRGQVAWDFFSNVTPSVIGGGPLAALYIARDNDRKAGEMTAMLLFAMLLDQIWFAITVPIILVSSLWIAVLPGGLGSIGEWGVAVYLLGILLWVSFFGYITLLRPDRMQQVMTALFRFRLLRRFQDRVAREMGALREKAELLRSQNATFFAKSLGWTFLIWMARYALVVFVVLSLFPTVDAFLVFMRTTAMTLGSLVMPTPGGSGGVEGLYLFFLGPPVMPRTLVAPSLLLWRVLGYYLFIALGGYLAMRQVHGLVARRQGEPADAAAEARESLPEPSSSSR